MKILSTQEINMVSGANYTTNFDLTLAAKEGALCDIVFGMAASLLIGWAVVQSINEAKGKGVKRERGQVFP
jgi:hypothetical protein